MLKQQFNKLHDVLKQHLLNTTPFVKQNYFYFYYTYRM